MMKIAVFNEQKDLPIKAGSVKKIVKEVLANENVKTDELAVHFVSTQKICELHQQFFQDPTSTDTISLPIDGPDKVSERYHVLGEIFICPQTAIDYLKQSKGVENPYGEVTLYLVHALLHLIGYDDIDPKDRKKMRAAEKRHMALLEMKNLSLVCKRDL